jgi:alkyldihydroxyacetonephosphate synthase
MDHKPFLAAEKGDLGIALIEAARTRLDPDGMMNPGKLIPDPARM